MYRKSHGIIIFTSVGQDTLDGLDGRRYFFEKFDRSWASQAGANFHLREALEIDSIPFEGDDELPDTPTHRWEEPESLPEA